MKPRFIFDFPLAADGTRRLLAFGAPREVLRAERLDEVCPVLLAAEERARGGAWVAGCIGYDAAPAFDAALRVPGRDAALPLVWFGVFDAPLPEAEAKLPPATDRTGPAEAWQPSIDRARFDADIAGLRRHIQDGDAYQINHTLRLSAAFDGDALAWFAALRAAQPDGYCAWLDLGTQQILSASPELFFRRDGDVITTRPMKGTARRGRWAAEDRQLADWLRNSEKNRAENLMIVDLLRNDLSRIARPHSVAVSDMFAVERHPTVWQMTSTIRATARAGTTLADLFAALFPCGSVTGAPKAKAMALIAGLETEPRGIYCGAIGLLLPGGDAVFNVAIRTVAIAAGRATCGVGGGITWDSTAGEEYAEAMLKARFLDTGTRPEAWPLFETLRLEDGAYWLLERHLARLAGSAEYFGYPFDAAACRARLASLAGEHAQGLWRVRLDLAPDGAIVAVASAMPATPARPTFALASTAVPRDAIWLYHKTTRRDAYEQALVAGQAAQPELFDVLLWNEAGELTEFTRGNLVLDIEGTRYTPPLACGLLDGVLRRELVDSGRLQERILTRADLDRAERIFFINSLRDEVEVWQAAGGATR